MFNNEIIERLENVAVPEVTLDRYRQHLRDTLIKQYAGTEDTRFQTSLFRSPVWKTAFITSAAWVMIVIAVIFGFVMPAFQSNSVEARVIEKVMAMPEIRSLLAGDESRNISLTDVGDNQLEILVESHGGRIIIARVNIFDEDIQISKISYVVLMGSIYEPEVDIIGDELERLIQTGKTDPAFRNLIDNGAEVVKAVAVVCLIITRDLDNGKVEDTRENWAMVTLKLQDENCYFLVDPANSRVIDRGCRTNTLQR